jgi:demethylmenaquinone methyltransferase/2-methoxy-6-polyprenyl-1,4-benzoquinol methylase
VTPAATDLRPTDLDKAPDRIAQMFDAIAPRYDLLNRVLSVGIDRRWRTMAIRSLRLSGRETLLDVCTGTADMAIESRRQGGAARVIGIDFARTMLRLGQEKLLKAGEAGRVGLIRGDAMRLPVADRSVDAVTIAFGIRNVQAPEVACKEMARALRPGGRLAILEFGVPKIPGISSMYLWYFKYLLPLVGRAVSGHTVAYSYLPASVGAFPPPADFMAVLRNVGFVDVRAIPLTFGIVYLYTAEKRSDEGRRQGDP